MPTLSFCPVGCHPNGRRCHPTATVRLGADEGGGGDSLSLSLRCGTVHKPNTSVGLGDRKGRFCFTKSLAFGYSTSMSSPSACSRRRRCNALSSPDGCRREGGREGARRTPSPSMMHVKAYARAHWSSEGGQKRPPSGGMGHWLTN